MRRRRITKRELTPDVKYNSELVARLINTLMRNGKKTGPEKLGQEALGSEEITEVAICEQDRRLTAKIYSEHDEEVIRRKINELNKHLSSYKQIANIIFYAEEFPKTSSKKIKRGEI